MTTDCDIPELEGERLLERINGTHANPAAVTFSGYNKRINPTHAAKTGLVTYLAKPIDHDSLLSCVSELTSLNKAS